MALGHTGNFSVVLVRKSNILSLFHPRFAKNLKHVSQQEFLLASPMHLDYIRLVTLEQAAGAFISMALRRDK